MGGGFLRWAVVGVIVISGLSRYRSFSLITNWEVPQSLAPALDVAAALARASPTYGIAWCHVIVFTASQGYGGKAKRGRHYDVEMQGRFRLRASFTEITP